MQCLFIQIKCDLSSAYEVADVLAQREIASEIYSTSGNYDLLAKFYLDDAMDIGRFVNEQVHDISGVRDTYTILTFKAF